MYPIHDISAVVLAGGQASRMGGVDKGLQLFRDRALVSWAIENVQAQVGTVFLNANRNLAQYQSLGFRVVSDSTTGYAGPLAGMEAALTACTTPWLVTLPCDCPYLPDDWVQRLWQSAAQLQTRLAMVLAPPVQMDGDQSQRGANKPLQKQPVFCLVHHSLLQDLRDYLSSGQRKIDLWTARHNAAQVAFGHDPKHPWAFVNLNTLPDLGALERRTHHDEL